MVHESRVSIVLNVQSLVLTLKLADVVVFTVGGQLILLTLIVKGVPADRGAVRLRVTYTLVESYEQGTVELVAPTTQEQLMVGLPKVSDLVFELAQRIGQPMVILLLPIVMAFPSTIMMFRVELACSVVPAKVQRQDRSVPAKQSMVLKIDAGKVSLVLVAALKLDVLIAALGFITLLMTKITVPLALVLMAIVLLEENTVTTDELRRRVPNCTDVLLERVS